MMARPNPICHTSQPEAKEEVQNLMKKHNRSLKEVQEKFVVVRARLKRVGKRTNTNPGGDSTTTPLPFMGLVQGQRFGGIKMDLLFPDASELFRMDPNITWSTFRDDPAMKEKLDLRDQRAKEHYPHLTPKELNAKSANFFTNKKRQLANLADKKMKNVKADGPQFMKNTKTTKKAAGKKRPVDNGGPSQNPAKKAKDFDSASDSSDDFQ